MGFKHFIGLAFFCFCIGSADSSDAEDKPVVTIVPGKVRGVKTKDHYEFRKIPYAKPPVGDLRFKVPEEPEPWNDEVLDASNDFSDYCIQYNVFWNTTEGREDCLYMNVFTPINPEKSQAKLPVMVYIHSGGFMFGRGSFFKADYLMETKQVVSVVFQYRLGSFGFLNTEDELSVGNFGMKDQVLALKWVQKNIKQFGGDPGNVFIFGTSAGAASVHYHILSPMSKGLFHRAYSGSGTALCPWAFQPRPRQNAIRLGQLLSCPTETNTALVNCLRQKDATDIAAAHRLFLDFYADPIAAFGPSLEVGNPDPSTKFLSMHPAEIIKKGVINEVPWMIGFNSDEGWEHTMSIFKSEKLLKDLNDKWEEVFPLTLEYVHESDARKQEISTEVRQFYFNNKPITEANKKNLSNAYSDKTYVRGTIVSAFRHARLGKRKTHPVYLFNFDYIGESSIVTLRGYPREGFGSNHMDDIQFLVNGPLFKFIDENHKDKTFQRDYVKLVSHFASTGTIIPFSEDRPDDVWQPLDPGGSIKWYHFTSQPKMEPISDDFSKRMKFWDAFNLQESAVSDKDYPRDEL